MDSPQQPGRAWPGGRAGRERADGEGLGEGGDSLSLSGPVSGPCIQGPFGLAGGRRGGGSASVQRVRGEDKFRQFVLPEHLYCGGCWAGGRKHAHETIYVSGLGHVSTPWDLVIGPILKYLDDVDVSLVVLSFSTNA